MNPVQPSASSPARPSPKLWTRRNWIATSLAGLAAAGCGKFSFHHNVGINGTIEILVWDSYFSDEIIAAFEAQSGVRVNVHLFSSNEQLNTIIRQPNTSYDLAMPSAFMGKHLANSGLLSNFNRKNIPNLANIDAKAFNPLFDPHNLFLAPYIWGATGIGYNAERVEGLPKSWADLFRHSSLAKEEGKTSVLDDGRFTLGSVLIYLGLSPSSPKPGDIQRAGEVLLGLKDYIHYFESDHVAKLLSEGTVELAMAWTGDVANAMTTNKTVRVSLPREGSLVFRDSFVIPRNAKNRDGAEMFINYLFDPVVAGAVTNHSYYATTIPAARPFVDRFLINGPTYFKHPAGKNFYLEDGEDNTDEYQRVWTEVRAAFA